MIGVYKLWNIVPEIDYDCIITDNSNTNENIFGIGYARTFLQSDLKRIFKINHSHISMYVDASVYKWQIWEWDIFNQMASGASHNKLIDGAVNEYWCNTDDTSSALISGVLPRIGTNYNKIRVNIEFLRQNKQ
jgi:hypothetical protein